MECGRRSNVASRAAGLSTTRNSVCRDRDNINCGRGVCHGPHCRGNRCVRNSSGRISRCSWTDGHHSGCCRPMPLNTSSHRSAQLQVKHVNDVCVVGCVSSLPAPRNTVRSAANAAVCGSSCGAVRAVACAAVLHTPCCAIIRHSSNSSHWDSC